MRMGKHPTPRKFGAGDVDATDNMKLLARFGLSNSDLHLLRFLFMNNDFDSYLVSYIAIRNRILRIEDRSIWETRLN